MHHFFFLFKKGFLNLGALKPFTRLYQKLRSVAGAKKKKKKKLQRTMVRRMKKKPWPTTVHDENEKKNIHDENHHAKKKTPCFRRLRVKEPPRHPEIIFAKRRYTFTPLFPTIEG